MKIKELISELEEIVDIYGDRIDIHIQHRDYGGDYRGTDEELNMELRDFNTKLIL